MPLSGFLTKTDIYAIQLPDKSQCRYDLLSLGEIMLRFDPSKGRFRTARQFKIWEGGGARVQR